MLVDVFVSRQIRQILHFVRKMPIRTSLVQGDWQEIVVGFQLMFREPPQTGSSSLQKRLASNIPKGGSWGSSVSPCPKTIFERSLGILLGLHP